MSFIAERYVACSPRSRPALAQEVDAAGRRARRIARRRTGRSTTSRRRVAHRDARGPRPAHRVDARANGTIAPATKAAGVLFQWPVALIPGAPDAVPNVIAQLRRPEPGRSRARCATGTAARAATTSRAATTTAASTSSRVPVRLAQDGSRRDDRRRGCAGHDHPPRRRRVRPQLRDARYAADQHAGQRDLRAARRRLGRVVPAPQVRVAHAEARRRDGRGGRALASVGSSGFSSGPHLHFEVYACERRR